MWAMRRAFLVVVPLATAMAQSSCGTSCVTEVAEDMAVLQTRGRDHSNQSDQREDLGSESLGKSAESLAERAEILPAIPRLQELTLGSGRKVLLQGVVPFVGQGGFFMALLFSGQSFEAMKSARIHCSDQQGRHRVPTQMFGHRDKDRVNLHCPWPQAEAAKGTYNIRLDDGGQKIADVQASYQPLLKQYGTIACINTVYNGQVHTLRLVPEWMEFHLLHGVDHFIVYTQNGTDVTVLDLYEPYIKAGLATRVHLNTDPKYAKTFMTQSWMANDCLYRAKGHTRWLMPTVDADEYFRLRKDNTRGDYFRTFWDQLAQEQSGLKNETVSTILIKRVNFERGNKRPDISAVHRYSFPMGCPKYVVKPDLVNVIDVHWPTSYVEKTLSVHLDIGRGFFAHYRNSSTRATFSKEANGRKPDVVDRTLLADVKAVNVALDRRFSHRWRQVAAKLEKGSSESILQLEEAEDDSESEDCPCPTSLVEDGKSVTWTPLRLEGLEDFGGRRCWDQDCPRDYGKSDIAVISNMAETSLAALKVLHNQALAACNNKERILKSGGWCYFAEDSKQMQKGDYSDADWLLPRFHVEFDKGLATGLAKLVLKDGDSVTDCGAGVGQAGHMLRALLPNLQYRGYDGAGNAEEFTKGFVRFADLSYPMKLAVSDWVISLEVGEHIPHEAEKEVVANLHAHNRKGLILSWAHLKQNGHGHVNCHSKEYILKLFGELGYKYDAPVSEALRDSATKPWLKANVMILRRA
ncbi:GALS1 [Symbiodinium natans]|uniref:GALS1 protein n=1 Tax=Symbiodinium natans TaxID=878477 RepID=A0A812JTP4_9DINO|nr:GALS1 [Symbiodinium natans]